MIGDRFPVCFYQRCDLVTLSVICIAHNNDECPYAGEYEKVKVPCFVPRMV